MKNEKIVTVGRGDVIINHKAVVWTYSNPNKSSEIDITVDFGLSLKLEVNVWLFKSHFDLKTMKTKL